MYGLNVLVQRRDAQRTVRCKRVLAGTWHSVVRKVERALRRKRSHLTGIAFASL